ncbi:hypothetical protein [Acidovorax temperans]|uniref:hypothetical protein n=1 Tax=Acidovorax temperans TaxID=80878 RepID=UPI0030D5BC32
MKSLLWHFEHGTTPKSSGSNQPEVVLARRAAVQQRLCSFGAVASVSGRLSLEVDLQIWIDQLNPALTKTLQRKFVQEVFISV